MTVAMQPDGAYAFHCDECPESIETSQQHFSAALEDVKVKGWVAYKGPDKKWAHSCPACVETFAKER